MTVRATRAGEEKKESGLKSSDVDKQGGRGAKEINKDREVEKNRNGERKRGTLFVPDG